MDNDPPPPYGSLAPVAYMGAPYTQMKIAKPPKFATRMVNFHDGVKGGVKVIPKGQPIPAGYTLPGLQPMPEEHLTSLTAEETTALPELTGDPDPYIELPLYADEEPSSPLSKIPAQPPDILNDTSYGHAAPILHRRNPTRNAPNKRGGRRGNPRTQGQDFHQAKQD